MTDARTKLPPDPEDANGKRAEWAASAVRDFQRSTGTDDEDALCDLLCDLMHWSDRSGLAFDTELARARTHYEAETAPDAATELLDAAERVVATWERGDLAGAVRDLDAAIARVKGESE